MIEPQGHGFGVVPGEASDGIEPGPQPALPTEMGPEPQPGLFLLVTGETMFPPWAPFFLDSGALLRYGQSAVWPARSTVERIL